MGRAKNADADDLIEKVKFYLAHIELRESIAVAGNKRILNEQAFASRFQTVFQRMGLTDE